MRYTLRALVVIVGAFIASGVAAKAAVVAFDQPEYWVVPGGSVTVSVQFEVAPGETIPVAVTSVKARVSGGDVLGALTTSPADVVMAVSGTYILDDSTGFNSVGTSDIFAIGGDTTNGLDEIKDPGIYSFMDITWYARSDAFGDYTLSFDDVGLGAAGFTFLADSSGVDSLQSSALAIVHVPEPATGLLCLTGGVALLGGRRRHHRRKSSGCTMSRR